jgi:hypothetical protein
METIPSDVALDYIANLVSRAIEHCEKDNVEEMELLLQEAEFTANQFDQDPTLTFS